MSNALIVDNDIVLVELMQAILQRSGYRTIATSHSEDSMALIYDHRPDIIILNDQMPQMTGTEICERIKRDPELRETPVIIVSAGQRVREPGYMARVGADAVVAKPYQPAELLRIVETLLDQVGH